MNSREKFGGGKSLSDLDHFKYTNKNRLEIDRHKKDRLVFDPDKESLKIIFYVVQQNLV